METDTITYVGLDVHKRTVAVAMLLPGRTEPIEWQEPHDTTVARRMARRMLREAPGKVVCCYEAGPTGYVLQRRLRAEKVMCIVVAPSLTPVQPGRHIKTDRKDARKLASLLRAGLLTEVHPPSEEQEALRDLCRCREDVQQDLIRVRHRLSKFLLRRHIVYNQTKHHWGSRHMAWLQQLRFDGDPASQAVFDSYMLAVEQGDERLLALENKIGEFGCQEPYREPVGWLRCFRGIDMVTAVSLVAELHDFRRFTTARQLMSYLGLVPRESSSGERERRGPITKAGNAHVRRLLVEAAWHNRSRPAIGLPLKHRRQGQPARVIAIADRAQERLHQRFVRMTFKGKPSQVVVVSMARELVGYIWSVLYWQPEQSSTQA